jgi:hypothetical protein
MSPGLDRPQQFAWIPTKANVVFENQGGRDAIPNNVVQ